jgi:hypothetical protein
MSAVGTQLKETSAPQTATSPERTGVSAPLERPSKAQQVLVWTFGILELLIDLASESVDRTRERVRVIQQLNGSHPGDDDR